jgi:hypothetical protein
VTHDPSRDVRLAENPGMRGQQPHELTTPPGPIPDVMPSTVNHPGDAPIDAAPEILHADTPELAAAPPTPSTFPPAVPFTMDGEAWLARVAGYGTGGTGLTARFALVAVHFARAEAPGMPLREALVANERLHEMFEEELIATYRKATPIPTESGAAQ